MAKYAVLQCFYASEKWNKLRLSLIAERGNRCQQCGAIIARSIDIIGHHIVGLTLENVHDANISLNPDNILIVCRKCHEEIHPRGSYKPEKKIFIVYGPPLSGKTTYVLQNKDRYDIVVDMDEIYRAVTLLPRYDKPDILLTNVRGICNLLIDNIKTRYGKWNNAWVIGGYANKYKREKLADELGAELIFCDVSKEECFRRLEMDEERRSRKDEWHKYIGDWFEKYTK